MYTYNQMMEEKREWLSEQERLFHKRHPSLLYNEDNHSFDLTFKDSEGSEFKACSDFYDPSTGYWIELKSSALNKHETQSSCIAAFDRAIQFARTAKTRLMAILSHGWNHCLVKQKIVQDGLTQHNIKSIVIFTDSTKLTYRANGDVNAMMRANLFWMWESQYFKFV